MMSDSLFCHLSSRRIADFIDGSKGPICFVAPGVHQEPAAALVRAGQRLGPELVTVWVDFDERVLRMGYGSIEAVKALRQAGIMVHHAPALRNAMIIAGREGYTFTPTPLYLEAEPGEGVRNALRLTGEQVAEALARLTPAARAVAMSITTSPEEKERIANLPEEGNALPLVEAKFQQVEDKLNEAPPAKFDLARQVQVFQPYLQYVELSLTGAAIQRNRLTIPKNIVKRGSGKEIEGRLRTTFELIEKNEKFSSKHLEIALSEIRNAFTRSLGKNHGRVVLKTVRPKLDERLEALRKELEAHQEMVKAELQGKLDQSRKQIVDYYLPLVRDDPPDDLVGESPHGEPTDESTATWLSNRLKRAFPQAETLIQKMSLEVRYKDITYETLNREEFLESVKTAYPAIDWDTPYNEFLAVGEGEET